MGCSLSAPSTSGIRSGSGTCPIRQGQSTVCEEGSLNGHGHGCSDVPRLLLSPCQLLGASQKPRPIPLLAQTATGTSPLATRPPCWSRSLGASSRHLSQGDAAGPGVEGAWPCVFWEPSFSLGSSVSWGLPGVAAIALGASPLAALPCTLCLHSGLAGQGSYCPADTHSGPRWCPVEPSFPPPPPPLPHLRPPDPGASRTACPQRSHLSASLASYTGFGAQAPVICLLGSCMA